MIGQPYFRVTFFHTVLYPTGIIVPAPLGWRNASISLERHKDFHSLIQYFKGSFVWYGKAREVIREVEDADGPDAKLRCFIEISFGGAFEEIFDGLIDVSQQEDISKGGSFYKQQAPIISNDFWSRFINRKDIPVNLQATVDLDGNARTAVNKIVLPLPSQVLRQSTNGEEPLGIAIYENDVSLNDFLQFSFSKRSLDEIQDVFTLLTGVNDVLPAWNIEVKFAGSYNIEVRVELSIKNEIGTIGSSTGTYVTDPTSPYIELYIRKNNETPIAFAKTDFIGQSTVYDINESLSLEVGDIVYIYGSVDSVAWKGSNSVDNILVWGNDNSSVSIYRGTFNPADASLISTFFTTNNFGTAPSGESIPITLLITANTTFPDTTTDAYLIGDAAESILSKITGKDNVLLSDALTTGCERLRAIMRGKHARGYDLATKELFMTFDQWWEGAAKQLPLGLGHTSDDRIEIESISEFYDKDFVVTFDNVSDLVRTYELEKIFKSVIIGFQKWSSESDSGIDDPQTKRTYRTKFETIGNEISILSKWMTASLAIERSRRNRVELGKDDRNDEEIFCINVVPDGSDYTPEFDENFDSITGLLNSDKRYNIRETPARMLLRWRSYLQGCLQHTTGENFYFASGEGNYEMQSDISAGDCEAGQIAENGNVPVTSDFIFIPKVYKFKKELDWETWKLILANKKKAIGVSRTTTGHVPCFIMNLDYFMSQQRGEFLVILGEDTNI